MPNQPKMKTTPLLLGLLFALSTSAQIDTIEFFNFDANIERVSPRDLGKYLHMFDLRYEESDGHGVDVREIYVIDEHCVEAKEVVALDAKMLDTKWIYDSCLIHIYQFVGLRVDTIIKNSYSFERKWEGRKCVVVIHNCKADYSYEYLDLLNNSARSKMPVASVMPYTPWSKDYTIDAVHQHDPPAKYISKFDGLLAYHNSSRAIARCEKVRYEVLKLMESQEQEMAAQESQKALQTKADALLRKHAKWAGHIERGELAVGMPKEAAGMALGITWQAYKQDAVGQSEFWYVKSKLDSSIKMMLTFKNNELQSWVNL